MHLGDADWLKRTKGREWRPEQGIQRLHCAHGPEPRTHLWVCPAAPAVANTLGHTLAAATPSFAIGRAAMQSKMPAAMNAETRSQANSTGLTALISGIIQGGQCLWITSRAWTHAVLGVPCESAPSLTNASIFCQSNSSL